MASIQEYLDKIKNAIFGKDVRQSIHDGLNKINQETESTSKKQEKLERTFDDLIINAGNSNAEVAAARNGFETLGKRLDGVDSQLDTKANLNSVFSMANMGQDVKEAMTGGSVAVVGKDTVLEENIVDGQVTVNKLSSELMKFQDGLNLFYNPYFTEINDMGTSAVQINKDIYLNHRKTSVLVTSSNDRLIINTTGYPSHAPIYYCEYSVTKEMLTYNVSTRINLNLTNGTCRFGLQFYDNAGSKLSENTINASETGEYEINDIEIPENTVTLRWFVMSYQSSTENVFEVYNPIFNIGKKAITYCTDTYFKNATKVEHVTSGVIDVKNLDDFKNAIEVDNAKINILNDIVINEEIAISKNINIYGNNFNLLGSDLERHLMLINNAVVKIENLNFYDGNQSILTCIGKYDVTLKNCILHRANNSVICFKGTGNATLKNCDVGYSNTNDGISIAEKAKVYIYDCKSHDNCDEGISSHNDSYCEVYGGEYYNNGYIVGTAETTKEKGATSSFGGVHLGGGLMGVVEGVKTYNNCTYGIALINFMNPTLEDKEICRNNIVKDNGGHGIFITASHELLISNNDIFNNVGSGIYLGLDKTYSLYSDEVASQGYIVNNNIYCNNNSIEIEDKQTEGYNMKLIKNNIALNINNEIVKPANSNILIYI